MTRHEQPHGSVVDYIGIGIKRTLRSDGRPELFDPLLDEMMNAQATVSLSLSHVDGRVRPL